MSSRVVIFFGEMGSGKSYVGERYARDHGLCFFEGDSVVTRELLDRSGRFKPIPRGVVREFVRVLARAVTEHAHTCESPTLVVSQALYLDEDRLALAEHLKAHGLTIDWRWVRTPIWRHVAQLFSRPKGIRWIAYGLFNKLFFQPPSHEHTVWPN